MLRPPRYDILFEPVKIGPVTAPNRFYQVPQCNGTGDSAPAAVAAMRGMKAEGGWGVVCTENAEISSSSEILPFPSVHLWADADIAVQARMVEVIHRHGALAGVELAHMGLYAANRASRLPTLGPSSHLTVESIEPFQARSMDKRDLQIVRRQHREAALRAKHAGFDIIYVYAVQPMSLASNFLARRFNQRTDEYGGSLENRCRLLKELLEETKDAVGDACAVALRFAVDECCGDAGLQWDKEGRDIVEMLKDLPDLWDVNLSDWSQDSASSRFAKEGHQEPYTQFVKKITSKPVVGVGRFTSPDTMVSQVRRGILDLIGAARPSIADPFLPRKIREGRFEDIRECIGCNVCISCENSYTPIRCTQNPTMMEEGRRGWHPENVSVRGSSDRVLIVGGGPAGLECALTLGRRGYDVVLAEGTDEMGGRVSRESRLPGLAEWARVRDYRLHQLQRLSNVQLFRQSPLDLSAALEFGAERIVVATGARWRRDGIGRAGLESIPGHDLSHVVTPDDIMDGYLPHGRVIIYDTDGTYFGNVIAELLRDSGASVTLVTPAAETAAYLALTLEQTRVIRRLVERGVSIVRLRQLAEIHPGGARLACVYGGADIEIEGDSVVLVTQREPQDSLYFGLANDAPGLVKARVKSVHRIGDCNAPNLIATAVYAGHRYARELDEASPVEVAHFPDR
jgi:dimethylamine/trimethylamine dehydrogenase